MSVIVLGAELPKGYDDCWYLQCNLWKDCYLNGIRDNCPLRPLPEKHGGLIDVDALKACFRQKLEDARPEFIRLGWLALVEDVTNNLLLDLDEAKILIEAEGE